MTERAALAKFWYDEQHPYLDSSFHCSPGTSLCRNTVSYSNPGWLGLGAGLQKFDLKFSPLQPNPARSLAAGCFFPRYDSGTSATIDWEGSLNFGSPYSLDYDVYVRCFTYYLGIP